MPLLIFIPLISWSIWLCQNRLIAMDEGFYLMAGNLVAQGQVPYLDFFYPQTPLLPYIYAAWFQIAGVSWEGARILSGLASGLLGILIYLEAEKSSGKFSAIASLVFYTFSAAVIGWFSTTKSYVLPTLFLFLAYMACLRSKSAWKFLLAGLLIGLAANIRLYLLTPLLPLGFWILFTSKDKKTGVRGVIELELGFLCSFLPHLWWMIKDESSWFFNNLGYHLIRYGPDLEKSALAKPLILADLLGLEPHASGDGLQFPVLLALSVLSLVIGSRNHARVLVVGIALILGITNFIPDPSFIQYFCVLVPFLALSAGSGLSYLWGHRHTWAKCLAVIVLFAYIWQGAGKTYDYTRTGIGVPGVRGADREDQLTIQSVDAVIQEVVKQSGNSKTLVLAQWPGFLLSPELQPYPGTENHFWIRVADKLSPEERRQYKLFSLNDLDQALSNPELKLVVIDGKKQKRYFPEHKLINAGFRKSSEKSGIKIYSRFKA